MGFLDNTTITVDAILTKKGREKLARNEFKITKFALQTTRLITIFTIHHTQTGQTSMVRSLKICHY